MCEFKVSQKFALLQNAEVGSGTHTTRNFQREPMEYRQGE